VIASNIQIIFVFKGSDYTFYVFLYMFTYWYEMCTLQISCKNIYLAEFVQEDLIWHDRRHMSKQIEIVKSMGYCKTMFVYVSHRVWFTPWLFSFVSIQFCHFFLLHFDLDNFLTFFFKLCGEIIDSYRNCSYFGRNFALSVILYIYITLNIPIWYLFRWISF